jgi:transcriptional regulator with XRE-family HTH domain
LPGRKPFADTPLAKYVEHRILELSPKKTQAEIAAEAGFVNPNMLSMVKSGATRLPLDRVPALASSLDVDPARLFQLALEQSSGSAAARAFETIFRTGLTANEAGWIREIREASGNSDPAVTTRSRAAIRALFGR